MPGLLAKHLAPGTALAGNLQAAAADVQHMAGGQPLAEQLTGAGIAVSPFPQRRNDQHGDGTGRVNAAKDGCQLLRVLFQGQPPGREAAADARAVRGKASRAREIVQCGDGRRDRLLEPASRPQRIEIVDAHLRRHGAAGGARPDARRAHVIADAAGFAGCGRRRQKGQNQPGDGLPTMTGGTHRHQRCR